LTLKNTKLSLTILLFSIAGKAFSQQIIDRCFLSPELGKFQSTEEIVQVCECLDVIESTNLVEWDGTRWVGALPYADVDLPPPKSCSQRAIWCGYQLWTKGGEAFALKLDKSFIAGNTYSYSFTYAQTGAGPYAPFSPILYTNKEPKFGGALKLGRLPGSIPWATNTFTFTAKTNQQDHTWLILHAYETSGLILADCDASQTIKIPFLRADTTACLGEKVILKAPPNKYYSYQWNTGETTSEINVVNPGLYSVEIQLANCSSTTDQVQVDFIDCTVILDMPNFFSPNTDMFNSVFKPISTNYLADGTLKVINRWGKVVFVGDMFEGWNGLIDGSEASTGVYFWECTYHDKERNGYSQKGFLNLSR
jgi:gliding motility-associated-like protein